MSVGGIVVETIGLSDRIWANTREPSSGDLCAIWLERTDEARSISNGDALWWQGGHAFWTPRSLGEPPPFSDRRIPRIGCSGIPRDRVMAMLADETTAAELIASSAPPSPTQDP